MPDMPHTVVAFNLQVAVKVLAVDSDEVHEAFMKEVALSACFRQSPHVIKLLGACLGDRTQLALIMELAEGGNLAQRIYNPTKRRLGYLEVCVGMAAVMHQLMTVT